MCECLTGLYLHCPAGESRHGHVQHEQRVQQHYALGDARLRETAAPREEVEHRRQAEAQDERQKHRERDEQRDPHHRQRSHLELTVDNSGGGGDIEPRLMNYANVRKLQDVYLFKKERMHLRGGATSINYDNLNNSPLSSTNRLQNNRQQVRHAFLLSINLMIIIMLTLP